MQNSSQKLGLLQYVLIAAALVTGIIHLALGADFLSNGADIMFLLNGIGFLGLTGLYLLPLAFVLPYRAVVRWVLIGYTVLTIVLWVVMNGQLEVGGLAAKLAELAIVVVLLLDRPKK
jgi:hypothetical protein